jgi:site-specific DNA-methyltransferase (adenine-specific)
MLILVVLAVLKIVLLLGGNVIKINTVHHMDNREGMAALPEKCASLIIADPPYFEVKGEFDFVWKSFDEYLEFMEEQAKAYKRILAENGTLYVYGASKRIAYVQVIFDKYFGLVNSLVWEKAERDGLFGSTGSEQLRSFPNSTERLLMYHRQTDTETPIGHYIEGIRERACLTRNDIDVALGYVRTKNPKRGTELCRRWEEGSSIPTEKDFVSVVELCGGGNANLGELRREYEGLRRPFKNYTKSTEVLKFRFVPSDHDHDTVKPDSISNCLVITSSRKGDLVVVPFAGSGSECVAAKKKGRDFIGFETTLKYVEMANERVRKETAQRELF